MKTLLACLLVTCSLGAACHSPSSEGPDRRPEQRTGPRPLEVASVARGVQSGHTQPAQLVLRTEPAWRAFWERHASDRLPAPPLPKVDFQREMLVVVVLGERPSGGWAVEVQRAVEEDGFVRVRARVSEPAPGSPQTAAITCPFHVVRLPRRPGPVEIVVE